MKSILITGASGFIGSHLSERLLTMGYHVIGVDNFDPFYPRNTKLRNIQQIMNHPKFDFYDVNVSSDDFTLAVTNNQIDTVIHLSARAGVRPSFLFPRSYVHHDIEATVNLLDTCLKLDIDKIIFGSSSSVYGNLGSLPYNEEFKLDKPISPYAAAKLSCELFNHVYHSEYGLNIFNLRFFTVYGPRQRPEMGIHKFTHNIDNGIPVKMFGNGTSRRDYTYIDDIIDGIILAAKQVKGYEIFNLGRGEAVQLNHLLTLIGDALEKQPIIRELPMQPGDVDETLADITKSSSKLGYSPKISIKDGISNFVKWYKESK